MEIPRRNSIVFEELIPTNLVEYRCYLKPDDSVDLLDLLKHVKGLHSRETAADILRTYRKRFHLKYGTYETGEPGWPLPVLRTSKQLQDFWSCLTQDGRKKAPLPDPNPALHQALERHFQLLVRDLRACGIIEMIPVLYPTSILLVTYTDIP